MAKLRKTAKTYDFNKFLNVDVSENKNTRQEKVVEDAAVKKPKKRRINVGNVLLVLFLLYTVIILGSQQLRLYRFEKDIKDVNSSIEQAEIAKENLRQQIELMNTDNYVEMIAREKLGLIKPGEIPYIAVPSDDEADVRIIDRNENIIDVED
jgi:cell division protein FtsL